MPPPSEPRHHSKATERLAHMVKSQEQRIQPALKLVAQVVDASGPYVTKVADAAIKLQHSLPTEIALALLGLGLCFFGGAFCASIAAAEAFYLTGWHLAAVHVKAIREELSGASDASSADHKKDDDAGTPSKKKPTTPSEQLQHKLRSAAMSIKNPERLASALGGLYAGWIAAQGTVRLHFARAITIGVSLANMLDRPAMATLSPLLEELIPTEYSHWIPTIVRGICKAIAFSLAWQLQVAISAAQSAVRGGQIFTHNALSWASANGYLKDLDLADSHRDEALGYFVAALGFCTQLVLGFSLFFPFNVVMLPFSLIEWYIRWSISA
uniref:Uncharacterized protein n=1 Tax=Chrysotila carterae TaxID=13221 RepID=A0A7S4F6V6_CHRCT